MDSSSDNCLLLETLATAEWLQKEVRAAARGAKVIRVFL